MRLALPLMITAPPPRQGDASRRHAAPLRAQSLAELVQLAPKVGVSRHSLERMTAWRARLRADNHPA